jgi:hypothetical protein
VILAGGGRIPSNSLKHSEDVRKELHITVVIIRTKEKRNGGNMWEGDHGHPFQMQVLFHHVKEIQKATEDIEGRIYI